MSLKFVIRDLEVGAYNGHQTVSALEVPIHGLNQLVTTGQLLNVQGVIVGSLHRQPTIHQFRWHLSYDKV
jgi:hypothetical protein